MVYFFHQQWVFASIFFLLKICPAAAFSPPFFDPSTSSTLLQPPLLSDATYNADYQMEFYIYSLFGSGPLLSGLSCIPQIRKDFTTLQSLSGGPTKGGETIDNLNPMQKAFLPEPLYVADVLHSIKVCPSTFPVNKLANPDATCAGSPDELQNYVSAKAFSETLVSKKKCNPLVADRLYQAVSGGTSKFVSVDKVNEKLQGYRKSDSPISLFAEDLGHANRVKIVSLLTFATLLGVVVELSLASGIKAFLPLT